MAHSKLVLVVDDEADAIVLLKAALTEAGLTVDLVVARDGQEAVDYLMAIGPQDSTTARRKPSLVLLDLNMPRRDGFAVLLWLRTRLDLKDMPVVVLSSSEFDDDKTKALKLGAREYLVKPNGFPAFIALLRQMHARYLATA